MSRRDLIIVSALINAGLLIVLFATALKPNGISETISRAPSDITVPNVEKQTKKAAVIAAGDEVDQVLKEFAARAMPDKTPASPQEVTRRKEIEVTPTFAPIATNSSKKEKKKSQASFIEELAAQYPSQVILPAPSKKRAVTPNGDFTEVRIQRGDYLDRIARRNGTTVSEIMRVNNLSSTNLKIGQLIKVPTKKRASKKSSILPRQTI